MKLDMKKVQSITGSDKKTVVKAGRRLSRRRIKIISKLVSNHPCVYRYIASGKSLSNISSDDWDSFTPEAREALLAIDKDFSEV